MLWLCFIIVSAHWGCRSPNAPLLFTTHTVESLPVDAIKTRTKVRIYTWTYAFHWKGKKRKRSSPRAGWPTVDNRGTILLEMTSFISICSSMVWISPSCKDNNGVSPCLYRTSRSRMSVPDSYIRVPLWGKRGYYSVSVTSVGWNKYMGCADFPFFHEMYLSFPQATQRRLILLAQYIHGHVSGSVQWHIRRTTRKKKRRSYPRGGCVILWKCSDVQ